MKLKSHLSVSSYKLDMLQMLQRAVQGIIQKLRNAKFLNILDVRVRIKGLQYIKIQWSTDR